MSQIDQTAADMAFIKQVVRRRENLDRLPAWIGPMWGAVTLVGCVWTDVRPQSAFFFWTIVPTIGFILTGALKRRQAAVGEQDAHRRTQIGLHWSTCFLGCVPLIVLAVLGRIDGHVVGQLFLLMAGIVNFLAGVHLDRRWLLPGLAMIAGSALISIVPHWGWTAFGVLVFLTLLPKFRTERQNSNGRIRMTKFE